MHATCPVRLRKSARNHILMQALEPRVLLSYTWITEVADTGNATTNGTNLQNVLNGTTTHAGIPLQLGDTIVLTANATYLRAGFTLSPISAGTGQITITSTTIWNTTNHDGAGTGVAPGVRVDPSDVSLMPHLQSTGSNVAVMRTLISGGVGAHDYNLVGLEFLPANDTAIVTNLILLGEGGTTSQSTVANAATNLVMDRCYVHGWDRLTTDYKTAISLNSNNTTIKNSYLSNIHNRGQDAQAIGGYNGPGNYLIDNNFLEATGEDFLMGGSDPNIPNLVINNITVTNNLMSKRATWNDNDPAWGGVHQSVKNVFELKNGSNVIVDHNIFENCWVGADQKAYAIVFTPRNQNGGDTATQVKDVSFTNNVIRHSGAAVNILGADTNFASAQTQNLTIRNNLFYDIGGPLYGYFGVGASGIGINFLSGGLGGVHTPVNNVTVDHNVLFITHNFLGFGSGNVPAVTGLTFNNNLVYHALYGAFGDNSGVGNVSLNQYAPGAVFLKNIIIGGNSNLYPANNFFPANADAAGLVDQPGDWVKLLPGSIGDNTATDGTDVGVNMANLDPEWIPLDSALRNFWKFNAGSGTSAVDSGNGPALNGTLSASTLWTTSGESMGGLALTGGTSGSVSVTGFTATSSYTYGAWIKPTSVAATQYILSTANNAFSLSINSTGKLVATGTTGTVTDATALTAGNWYFVTVTLTGGTLTVYKNGVSVGSIAATTTTSSTTLTIGGNNGSVSSFNGTIDEVRFHNAALSASDVAIFYKQHAPQQEDGYNGAPTGNTGSFSTYAIGHVGADGTNYTYHWGIMSKPAGAPDPTFSNQDNTTSSTTVTYYANGNYVLTVTATDQFGASSTFKTGNISLTAVGTPAAPTGLTATADSNSIMLAWTDNSTNETGFHVWRSTTSGSGFTTIASPTAASYDDTTAVVGTTYYYYVTAYNANGDSAPTNTANATIVASGAQAYDGFNYTAGDGSNIAGHNTGTGFSANWTTSNNTLVNILSGSLNYSAGGHALQTAANSINVTNQANATGTLTTALGTIGTTTWIAFELKADRLSGSATLNSEVKLNSSNLRLGSPLSGNISGIVTQGANNWYLPSSIPAVSGTTYFVAYKIQYLATGDVIDMFVNPTPGVTPTTPTATLTLPATVTLPVSSSLVIRSANDATVTSTFDEIRIGTTYLQVAPENTTPTPNAPSSCAVAPSGTSLNVTWADNSTNETGFHVWRSTDNINFSTVQTTAANATAWLDNTVVGGTLYYYKITAFNGAGDSAFSNTASATAPIPLPNAPSNLVMGIPGTSSISMTWTDNATNETGFHVFRSTDNATWGSAYATIATPNTTSYTDNAPAAGVAYFYKVTAYNATGDSTGSAGITCAVATVQASDGFNYTVGDGSNIAGHNTGVGLSANWTTSNNTLVSILSGSLNYSAGGHALTTSANAIQVTNAGSATGTMATSVGTLGTTIWIGFEVKSDRLSGSATLNAELKLNSSQVRLGSPLGGNISGIVTQGANNWYLSSTVAAVSGATNFVVYKIQYLSTGTIIDMFVNPTPGVTPVTPTNSLTLPATVTLPISSSLVVKSNNDATVTSTFDEIRIGTSYAAVAPDPLVDSPLSRLPRTLVAGPVNFGTALAISRNRFLSANLHALPIIAAPHADAPSLIETPSYHFAPQTPAQSDNSDSQDPLLDDADAPILEI